MPAIDLNDPKVQLIVALIFGVLIIAGIVLARDKNASPARKYVPPPPPVELARIDETVTLTGAGAFSGVLLVLHNMFMGALFLFGTRSAVQETSLGTIWIAGNVLWGVCMLMGRKRTYRVLRDQKPPQPPPG